VKHESVTQPSLLVETWDEKMKRLAQELKALRIETEFVPADDKRWRKWSPRYQGLRYEIDLHMRKVPDG
jgi:hypothetical protein